MAEIEATKIRKWFSLEKGLDEHAFGFSPKPLTTDFVIDPIAYIRRNKSGGWIWQIGKDAEKPVKKGGAYTKIEAMERAEQYLEEYSGQV